MNTPALGTAHAISLQGLEGTDVAIEATLLTGLPVFTMVGLADTAVIEAKERLRASFHNVGLGWPNQRLTVNLSPADTAKSGAGFDLGIAAAIIGALGYGQLPADTFLIGELGLDGAVRGVRGVLPALLAAQKLGFRQAFVPEENKHEAELVSGISIISIANLAALAAKLRVPRKLIAIPEVETVPGSRRAVPEKSANSPGKSAASRGGNRAEESFGNLSQLAAPVKNPEGDISDVYGQEEAIWALQIAAIGGHHTQMLGPPGVGKSMLAERFPALLPPLVEAEAMEVAAIRSLCGVRITDLPWYRPFISPHHTISVAALIGGGSGTPLPGAITLAHRGVLYCDEFAEFPNSAIQSLRQPLEKGWIELQRTRARLRYPAAFQLLAAANPCRCGMGPASAKCSCTSHDIRLYRRNLGGPIRDRIDIRLQLRRPSRADMRRGGSVSSKEAQEAVAAGIFRQRRRAAQDASLPDTLQNKDLPGKWLRQNTPWKGGAVKDLERHWQQGQLSLRGIDKILRIAWSTADFFGHDSPHDEDIAAACLLRGAEGII
ncbi:YifB family Mg chelatase-like AAA ATPase [uncultured Arcanobacterium sp.]|uniref:YifB family Mg chelatase-like AAA ATPase n=1 Tax=uncultured Arcanobacterium sp. TaxID=487520 RepID=UPI00261B7B53|nr:ATP-binding protein [uncultured Arcanobacterium sp.]